MSEKDATGRTRISENRFSYWLNNMAWGKKNLQAMLFPVYA